MTATKIIENNIGTVVDYFEGVASCDYYDGLCRRLYLDLDDNSISESTEASENTWLQRDDGSLVEIARISGYCDTPDDERYTDGCDLMDYGYDVWVGELEGKINAAIKA
ncbi:MAG: hypothetical protein R8K20_11345 [Gallionellaceae bacterium]